MATARIFKNGNSQAVRLPKEFRVEGKQLSIYHFGKSIVLQPVTEKWKDVFLELKGLSDEDFNMMINSEDFPLQEREVL